MTIRPSRISGKTALVALLGSPVSHSKSPAMQNTCFREAGVDLAYVAFDVPAERAGEAVAALRVLGARGANVTMPLKKAVVPFLDDLSDVARLAGAVNTIVNAGGRLTGHITDGEGFLQSLDDEHVDWRAGRITLLGAGGAGAAVAIEAASRGCRAITLCNVRDAFLAEAERLAGLLRERFGCDARALDLADGSALRTEIAASTLLVNATPVGMEATRDQSVITDSSMLHRGLVVADLIYVPARTRLLEMAQAAGCRTVGGIGMQLHQGARSFRLWSGMEMPLDVARAILMP